MAVRSSQVTAPVLGWRLSNVRASQLTLATIGTITARVRASQVTLLALVANLEQYVVTTYPVLEGLGYSVVKRPIWNTNVQAASSGREVRIGYYTRPIWEWDLLYEVLPDFGGVPGWSTSDIRTLLNFYNTQAGSLGQFFFTDPDDYTVTLQSIGTGDSVTADFILGRSLTPTGFFEPIGYVDLTQPFSVYINGVVVPPADYTVSQSTYYDQTVNFASTPATGVTVAVSMNYFWVCRFKDDQYDFEKFANLLWTQKKITLRSTRGT